MLGLAERYISHYTPDTGRLMHPATGKRLIANTVTSADIAGVSLRTIYRWVRENRVEWLRTPGGQIRIYVDSLLKHPPDD